MDGDYIKYINQIIKKLINIDVLAVFYISDYDKLLSIKSILYKLLPHCSFSIIYYFPSDIANYYYN